VVIVFCGFDGREFFFLCFMCKKFGANRDWTIFLLGVWLSSCGIGSNYGVVYDNFTLNIEL
jgi:hypothetical protein